MKALMVGVWVTPEELEAFNKLKLMLGEKKNAPVLRYCFKVVSKAIEDEGMAEGTKPRKIRSQMDLWRKEQAR